MPEKIKYFFSSQLNQIFLLFGVFFLVFALAFYLAMGKSARDSLAEQMLHREQVAARAGAASIESFLTLAGKSLKLLSYSSSILSYSKDTQDALDDFIAEWQDTPLLEVILTDEKGEVLFVANKQKTEMEKSFLVSDRDYFIETKKAQSGQLFVGKPILSRFGAYEGQYIVRMAVPVFKNGEFSGVLGAAVVISELTKAYLDSLKFSEKTQVYLMDSDGTIIVSPSDKLVGANYFEYLNKNSFLGSKEVIRIFKQRLESRQEGKLKVAFAEEQTGELTPFLLAHSPVNIDNHWMLTLATPLEDALVFIAPFYVNQIGVIFVSFSVLILFAVVIAKSSAFRESFEAWARLHKEKDVDYQ